MPSASEATLPLRPPAGKELPDADTPEVAAARDAPDAGTRFLPAVAAGRGPVRSPFERRGEPRQLAPSLRIHIDSIEIRTPEPAFEAPSAPLLRPRLSLTDYLEERRGGRR